jgi:Zn-dependent protease with chaperone function
LLTTDPVRTTAAELVGGVIVYGTVLPWHTDRGVLLFVGLSAVLCPLASAGVSRQAEFAADRYAATRGLALELAAALHATDDAVVRPRDARRLGESHPTSEQRIRALLVAMRAG